MTAEKPPTRDSRPSRSSSGLFLPTGVWTKDRLMVEQEKQRLLPWRTILNDLMNQAHDTESACTWYLMAEATLAQIDRDLDDLYEWLEAIERGDAVCEKPER
ncbi:MAG: hypothetical protein FHP92_05140 [Denitromonas halophila]|uniref:Uncharacterized protein n=2 Tax=Denitromonas TaxID=139331 RepID=A0A558EA52_9RHOO|nr:hypothetical protein FHP90_14785 [Denitromonas ohlonensis]TVO76160.1 hypothetical protein FHP89_11960 [Denitromonas ohlonensis]TVT47590.1 MAG: hypothetical protein FHP94_13555 [Denitromonas halophila]TVT70023.1 MAG: hypothetical protein FHP93_12560 [Denitromonas halophila]TVT77547.1 MAG: hypothetical protein FHP92_05140 [Denitromonas halophila]